MRRARHPRAGRGPLIRLVVAALLLLLACASGNAGAAPASLAAQRELFRHTATAIARGDRDALPRARAKLAGYPLLPALESAELRARLASAQAAEIDAFLARYPGQWPAERVRRAWTAQLAAAGRWPDYLRYQPEPPTELADRCTHAWAVWQASGAERAHPEVLALWLTPRSLPAGCNRLLAAWAARGHPDAAQAWERFDLAMQAGEVALARYLLRSMDAAHRADAELFLALHDAPARVAGNTRLQAGNPRHARIAAHALVRLAASDAEAARRGFETLARAGVLDEPAQRAAAPRIALGLAALSPARASEWSLGLAPAARSDELAEDSVRFALRAEDWNRVDAALRLLPPALAASPNWLYWSGRTAAARGSAGTPTTALDTAREDRSWYGFLAADRLGKPYAMRHEPVAPQPDLRTRVEQDPGIQRAREYDLIGEVPESRREWAWTVAHLTNEEREVAAALAGGWGWYTLAITALASAQSWDDLELRFPDPFTREFTAAARRERLEPQWLFAIARQESAMNPGARSPAGALGLMQVMPATAQLTARRAGIPYRGATDLLNPATNVVIGSRYMRMMLDDFSQNRILAAAAYNAGPGRVRQWVGRFPAGADHDVFVESIPFRETRKYVQNVLSYAVIYAYLQGRSVPLVSPGERRINPRPPRAG